MRPRRFRLRLSRCLWSSIRTSGSRSRRPHSRSNSLRMDLTQFVEHHGGIAVIPSRDNIRAWNGIEYRAGLSAKNVRCRHLSMNVATVPPGGVAYAHVHVGFEVMLYILSGRVRHEFGDKLRQSVDNEAGD